MYKEHPLSAINASKISHVRAWDKYTKREPLSHLFFFFYFEKDKDEIWTPNGNANFWVPSSEEVTIFLTFLEQMLVLASLAVSSMHVSHYQLLLQSSGSELGKLSLQPKCLSGNPSLHLPQLWGGSLQQLLTASFSWLECSSRMKMHMR